MLSVEVSAFHSQTIWLKVMCQIFPRTLRFAFPDEGAPVRCVFEPGLPAAVGESWAYADALG